MHQKVLAEQKEVRADVPAPQTSRPAMLVALVYALSTELHMDPAVYRIEREGSLWVYYACACFECGQLFEEYGYAAGYVSQVYPVSLYGVAGGMEPVALTMALRGDGQRLVLRKLSVSGKNFDQLSDLCVKIEVESPAERAQLFALLQDVRYRKSFVAARRSSFVQQTFHTLPDDAPDAFFRYVALREDAEPASMLEALTVEQQKELWLLLLRDGMGALEFETVWEQWEAGGFAALFTWELSLRMALSEAGCTIHNGPGDFRVTDAESRRLRFDFQNGSAAEKLFLKLLFPVRPEGGCSPRV